MIDPNDVVAEHGVEIVVRHDGLVIWVNVDGICAQRIITNGFVDIKIDDCRKVAVNECR
jgi:hypothetical protein